MKHFLPFILIFLAFAGSCQPAKTRNVPQRADTSYVYKSPSSGGTGKFYMGREIAHVMDASGSAWLERATRSKEENTDLMVSSMQLTPDMVLADIGAGTGYYTFRVAKKVPNGRVYAVEIQEELIDALEKKKSEEAFNNVEVVRGDTINVNLPDSTVDLAFMVDVYHELFYPKETLQSIKKSLKPNGKLLLIEYRGEDPEVMIKPLHKTTVAQLTRELEANGFVLDRRVDDMPIQHFLVFKVKR
jgi:ubiquinone/menaquinone biosynthesis C-methylase UbiE